jgi:CMP-N-acetylneuraminic acid synthetase
MSIYAFIPARSGSTRLKNKNILLINKRPLIYWSVKAAINLKLFDVIIFSSDSKKYLKILMSFLKKDNLPTKKIIFDLRTVPQANKKKKIFDYIKNDLVKKFKFSNKDLIIQMLPTAPLRKKKNAYKGN